MNSLANRGKEFRENIHSPTTMNITPNKRKREPFSSVQAQAPADKENYAYNSGFMEVKSLADLKSSISTNPFEVTRKPPKKKKKLDCGSEENCFVNPALDLLGPEHVVINPFEIRRPTPREGADKHCFVNSGLNIRGPEKEVRNPFEIRRQNIQDAGELGFQNEGFNLRSPINVRAIAIPFTPTVGCRINFTDVPLESLTPCSMLAKKLVFSPGFEATPKKSTLKSKADQVAELSAISEESLDIQAELDCYQLELENSINEAKINKKKRRSSAGRGKNLMDCKNRACLAQLLNVPEPNTLEDPPNVSLATQTTPKLDTDNSIMPEEETPKDSSGVDYEEVNENDQSENEFEFKNPAPFQRTYKRKSIRKPDVRSSAESLTETTKPKSLRSSIRNSIRRILKPNEKKSNSSDQLNENNDNPPSNSNLLASIRQSLRRKPAPKTEPSYEESHELSILVDTERKVFRQKSSTDIRVISVEDVAIDSGTFGRKTSLRSSFRNTTKDVRRQVLKSMFKKNVEEYQFEP